MIGRPPAISAFSELLSPVDISGPARFIYSYNHERTGNEVDAFLEKFRSKYVTALRMVGMKGQAPWEKWHMLDPKDPPPGIAKDHLGNKLSLTEMGEFKNNPHQSRIFHCTQPGGLIVLLTVFTEKKEDDLTAEAVNPALRAGRSS